MMVTACCCLHYGKYMQPTGFVLHPMRASGSHSHWSPLRYMFTHLYTVEMWKREREVGLNILLQILFHFIFQHSNEMKWIIMLYTVHIQRWWYPVDDTDFRYWVSTKEQYDLNIFAQTLWHFVLFILSQPHKLSFLMLVCGPPDIIPRLLCTIYMQHMLQNVYWSHSQWVKGRTEFSLKLKGWQKLRGPFHSDQGLYSETVSLPSTTNWVNVIYTAVCTVRTHSMGVFKSHGSRSSTYRTNQAALLLFQHLWEPIQTKFKFTLRLAIFQWGRITTLSL